MKTLFALILLLSLSFEARCQNDEWKGIRVIGGGAMSYFRSQGNEDYVYLGTQIPLSPKLHTGLNYGYFSRQVKTHQIGITLGYGLLHSNRHRLFLKTDLSYFTKNPAGYLDSRFFRHSFGVGYLVRAYRRVILDVELNMFGFYYGRSKSDPNYQDFVIYKASEAKIGIGYTF
ncbi:hypothetical protein K1X84_13315 [bacterium]|nr:hypothetical protein [bacterium]